MYISRCVFGNSRVLVRRRQRYWASARCACAYHTKHGVFGYKPDKEIESEITAEEQQSRHSNCNLHRLVDAYRSYGHRLASIDPVNFKASQSKVAELNTERYGLGLNDYLDSARALPLHNKLHSDSVQGLVSKLKEIYCGPISYEYVHLESEAEREWFARRVECADGGADTASKLALAADLLRSQTWDQFLNTKFPAVKKYGGEGADTLVSFLRTVVDVSAADGIKHIVVGMPHRGRLNLLTVLLQSPPVKIFSKYAGKPEFPPSAKAMGDIAQHFSASVDFNINGNTVHLSMLNNPSHLEAVNPVSMGKTRSKQLELEEGDYSTDPGSRRGDRVINLQIHGDAAIVGQGINQECLMMSRVPHFDVGGSVHLIVNNQIGFTTPADRGRSSRYASDVAKMISAPVIHVNAEYPEEVANATRIALEYRSRFRKDVFVDYNCYRKTGHNEVDDPTFTNPALYRVIHSKKSITDQYVEQLQSDGILKEEDVKRVVSEYTQYLQSQYELVSTHQPEEEYYKRQWTGMQQAPSAIESWDTGVAADVLRTVGEKSVYTPPDFTVHPHLAKTHVKNRLKKLQEGRSLDWATAEALAFGSLLWEGTHVRLSGEDVGRGTFSHRHVMLVDNETNDICVPLNRISEQQKAFLEVANSILSEEAVLGFEYGMAADSPHRLVVWEAQFGDFFNSAQTIIDTYISSGESKWMTSCGLVMLLPHGYDGAASDHSSCRLERFLQLTDSSETSADGEDANMHLVCPTTPAQYFHLLRRQMVRNYRKPLIIVSPKIMLRMSEATSQLSDFLPGTHYQPVLGDTTADPLKVRRVILTSGKHYYALHAERLRGRVDDVAILRLESLCPFPLHHINQEITKYKNARTFVWSQEEHRNMGPWSFVRPRFENLAATKLKYAGRKEGATVAVGVSSWHKEEAKFVVEEPLYNIK